MQYGFVAGLHLLFEHPLQCWARSCVCWAGGERGCEYEYGGGGGGQISVKHKS